LKRIGIGLDGDDILRSRVRIDEEFFVWSSDPMLVWSVVREAFLDRMVNIPSKRRAYAMPTLAGTTE
jgi:hypothetical protein